MLKYSKYYQENLSKVPKVKVLIVQNGSFQNDVWKSSSTCRKMVPVTHIISGASCIHTIVLLEFIK